MNIREQKAKDRECRRREWIRKILSRTPYTPETSVYVHCTTELNALGDDVLMILALPPTG